MSASFETAFQFVIEIETDKVTNDPRDKGGLTKYGISTTANPGVNIRDLTLDDAKKIYQASYWDKVRGNDLHPAVALVVFDGAVNQGVRTISTLLQISLNGRVVADGEIGDKTVDASHTMLPEDLVGELCARRAMRYASGDVLTYGLGWFRRLFYVHREALDTMAGRLGAVPGAPLTGAAPVS